MIELLPILIQGAVEIFTNDPQTVKEVVKTAVENPVQTSAIVGAGAVAAVSLPVIASKYITGRLIPIRHLDEVLMVLHKVLIPLELVAHYSKEAVVWVRQFIKVGEQRLKEHREKKK